MTCDNFNLLESLAHLANCRILTLPEVSSTEGTRINSLGKRFEEYVKILLSKNLDEKDFSRRLQKIECAIVYDGGVNNPPDLLMRHGDAIEVKKVEIKRDSESMPSHIPLNSSPPRRRIYSNDSRITKEARECEEWHSRDVLYIVGAVRGNHVHRLALTYGDVINAPDTHYSKIIEDVSVNLELAGLKSSLTNELARFNNVDANGTYLRIRAMWNMPNPLHSFRQLLTPETIAIAVMRLDKFASFPAESRKRVEEQTRIGALELLETTVADPSGSSRKVQVVCVRL